MNRLCKQSLCACTETVNIQSPQSSATGGRQMIVPLRTFLTIAAIFLPLMSVAAQQKPSELPSSARVVERAPQESVHTETNNASHIFGFAVTLNKHPATDTSDQLLPRTLLVFEPTFLFKDGAARLLIFPDSPLIPLAGGGASGCFSLEAPDRARKLSGFFQILSSPRPDKR